jgi:hypothetical protein
MYLMCPPFIPLHPYVVLGYQGALVCVNLLGVEAVIVAVARPRAMFMAKVIAVVAALALATIVRRNYVGLLLLSGQRD